MRYSSKQADTPNMSKNPNMVTAYLLESASSLDLLLLLQFRRDTYPDRESHTPLRHRSSAYASHLKWTGRSGYASFGQDRGFWTGLVCMNQYSGTFLPVSDGVC